MFGVGGIIGNSMYLKLSAMVPSTRLFAFDHPRADISNPAHIAPLVNYIKPTVIVNCAGINDLELCEDNKDGAIMANTVGPRVLAAECAKRGIKLIHFSSPHVFDGKAVTPYTEKSRPSPVNAHGRSKLDGELAIIKSTDNFLIIRPGWVFGEDGESCITDWIAKAERGLNVPVMEDLHGSPTHAGDMVNATIDLMEGNKTGIFHVCNAEAATYESFARETMAISQLKDTVTPSSAKLRRWYKAPRGRRLVLSSKKYSIATGKPMRPWKDALRECLFNMHHYRPGDPPAGPVGEKGMAGA
jgi:dTDP-4-dehydrorhamnose reductase